MKHVLCFGDSNTYGANPNGGRWDIGERWTSVLGQLLGDDYRIIEEGCSARTSVFSDDLEHSDVGELSLPIALKSHRPLDLVILMLGTNDMKHRFNLLPIDIAVGSARLVSMIKKFDYGPFKAPQILLVSPINIAEGIENSLDNSGFSADAVEISKSLAPFYKRFADSQGCMFLDASKYAKPSKIDLLHMDKDDHKALAQAMYDVLKENNF